MKSERTTATVQVNVPTIDDYAEYDPRRASSADGDMAEYWSTIVRAENLPRMLAAIEAGRPPIVAVADELTALWVKNGGEPEDGRGYFNSWSGAVTAYFCEVNGCAQAQHKDKPWKQPIGRDGWGRGQMMATGPQTPKVEWKSV